MKEKDKEKIDYEGLNSIINYGKVALKFLIIGLIVGLIIFLFIILEKTELLKILITHKRYGTHMRNIGTVNRGLVMRKQEFAKRPSPRSRCAGYAM